MRTWTTAGSLWNVLRPRHASKRRTPLQGAAPARCSPQELVRRLRDAAATAEMRPCTIRCHEVPVNGRRSARWGGSEPRLGPWTRRPLVEGSSMVNYHGGSKTEQVTAGHRLSAVTCFMEAVDASFKANQVFLSRPCDSTCRGTRWCTGKRLLKQHAMTFAGRQACRSATSYRVPSATACTGAARPPGHGSRAQPPAGCSLLRDCRC